MGFIELLWESQRVAIFGWKMMKRRVFPGRESGWSMGKIWHASSNGEGGSRTGPQGVDDVAWWIFSSPEILAARTPELFS